MSETTIEIPKAIHHSRRFQQMDLGENIYLFKGEGPDGPRSEVGEIYNFEQFPCLEDEQCEDFEVMVIKFADKIVRAYNSHDDLLKALKAITPKECPIVTHHKPNCGICAALRVIAKVEERSDADTV